VEAAGPLYVISALIFVSLVWCLPQALFSAELSLMIPENGGCVIWVRIVIYEKFHALYHLGLHITVDCN
jgi:amino acid transporter